MPQEHLSTDRLLALYHGDVEDFAGLEHLASCSECRRTFDDTRWARLLGRLREPVAAGPHPGTAEIAAYHTHALPSPRIAEIERHLRSCEACLARAGRAREAERRGGYRSPSPAAVRTTMLRFRPRPLLRLGTVVVAALGRGVRLTFMPQAGSDEAGSLALGMAESIQEQREAISSHPASASRRARRIAKEVLEPLIIPADGLDLVLTARSENGNRRLEVRLVPEADRPVRGVRVRLRGPADRQVEGVTDEDGRTTLPFEPDATELIVEAEPALALRFRFAG